MPTGGDILEITYNHATLGTGVIFPKSNEDSTLNLGGFRSEDDENMIDGGANMIDKINRTRWSAEFTVAWDMSKDLTLEKLVALAGSPVLATWTITHINGSVYVGTGKPVGDIAGNGNNATLPLKIAGGSVLKKQA